MFVSGRIETRGVRQAFRCTRHVKRIQKRRSIMAKTSKLSVRDTIKCQLVKTLAKFGISVSEHVWIRSSVPDDHRAYLMFDWIPRDDMSDISLRLKPDRLSGQAQFTNVVEMSIRDRDIETAWDKLPEAWSNVEYVYWNERKKMSYGVIRTVEKRRRFPLMPSCRSLEEFAVKETA